MPSKCKKCSVELKQGDLIAKCADCNDEFHPACTPLGTQNSTKTKLKNYKCESCVSEINSVSSQHSTDSTAAVDKRTLMEALNNFKTDLKNHVDTTMGTVMEKLDSFKEDVKILNTKINALEQNQDGFKDRCDKLEQTNATLVDEVRSLHVRLNDSEQHSRCANIEIVGVPVTPGENVYYILQKIATALGISFKGDDVSMAHRLRLFSKKLSHPPIIAQFVIRTTKEKWISAARAKGKLRSTDVSANLQASDVYINNHLTAHNKGLLGRARGMQRDGKLHFVGYFNGKILIKLREKDAAVRICQQEDLDKYDK